MCEQESKDPFEISLGGDDLLKGPRGTIIRIEPEETPATPRSQVVIHWRPVKDPVLETGSGRLIECLTAAGRLVLSSIDSDFLFGLTTAGVEGAEELQGLLCSYKEIKVWSITEGDESCHEQE